MQEIRTAHVSRASPCAERCCELRLILQPRLPERRSTAAEEGEKEQGAAAGQAEGGLRV